MSIIGRTYFSLTQSWKEILPQRVRWNRDGQMGKDYCTPTPTHREPTSLVMQRLLLRTHYDSKFKKSIGKNVWETDVWGVRMDFSVHLINRLWSVGKQNQVCSP